MVVISGFEHCFVGGALWVWSSDLKGRKRGGGFFWFGFRRRRGMANEVPGYMNLSVHQSSYKHETMNLFI